MKTSELKIPSYKIEDCKIGIVHLGVGNFHRAHQALYINNYIEKTNDKNWSICGINLRKEENENFNFLKKRNGKYILKTASSDGEIKFSEIHSIKKLIDWSEEKEKAENILCDENVEIVTMTVTESGYYINEDNNLNLNLQIVKDNISQKENTIIFSFLLSALKKRMDTLDKEITLLCCDNIRENGLMLEKCLKQYVEQSKELKLLKWIEQKVSFPSCVVDRITPRSPNYLKKEIKENFDIDESCSVMAEPFIQWVIEDNFIGNRPKLEDVGVQFVNNVFPYEESKIRILNGGHVALSYIGALKGHKTYDQAILDRELQQYFFELERKEIIPALNNIAPFNLEEYMMIIFDRFKNENIGDKLERIAMDGVGKFPIFILPTINKCFELNIHPENAIESIASWYIFMKKINNKTLDFNYYEPSWDWIKKYLEDDMTEEFIFNSDLWGETPNKYPEFSNILRKKILFFKKIFL
ncbi:mannitol dehydrogenase family protein [Pelagibacteraceae bacterium]|nr:mannitol dehydrogenase family protein [Pelagibacteraceae bacterium]